MYLLKKNIRRKYKIIFFDSIHYIINIIGKRYDDPILQKYQKSLFFKLKKMFIQINLKLLLII